MEFKVTMNEDGTASVWVENGDFETGINRENVWVYAYYLSVEKRLPSQEEITDAWDMMKEGVK